MSHERGSERSEWASEQVSAAKGANEASSLKQANEWALQANKRTDEWVAQYFSLYSWLFWPTVQHRKWKEEKQEEERNEGEEEEEVHYSLEQPRF